MKARLLQRKRQTDGNGNLTSRVIWLVPRNERHPEGVRYRLAFVPGGARAPVVLYDNHHPKGHHRHLVGKQEAYGFTSVRRLREDFDRDVAAWKNTKGTES